MKQAPLDTPIKVSIIKYEAVRTLRLFQGVIAYRKDHRGYYIKRLWPVQRKEVERFLNS